MSPDVSFDAAIAFARDLIRLPSPSGAEEQVARRVRREMEALRFSDVRLDAWGNVIGRVRGTGGGPTVMLSCHLDVVPEGDAAGWEHPPFSGAVADGFLHGRGAMDIKGPLALQTYAAAALRGRAPGDIVVAHTVFEERGGLGMDLLLRSGEVRPDAVVIGESTGGDICIGHRGRAEIEVVVRGRAGHASAPERARNPLDLLPGVLEAVGEVAADQPEDAMLGRSSIAVTDVAVSPAGRNVIPDRVVVVLDWRILPEQEGKAAVARVERAVSERLGPVPEGWAVEVRLATETQETWTGVEAERDLYTPGFLMSPEDPLVQAAARALEGSGADRSSPGVRPWTFATDGGWTHGVHGVPTIGFAPGREHFAHTNRERLDLREARSAFDSYPALVLAMMDALA